jgi:hypothetical protein
VCTSFPLPWSGLTCLAGFCHHHALILYVYLPNEGDGDDSVLTVNHTVALMSLLLMIFLVLRQLLQRVSSRACSLALTRKGPNVRSWNGQLFGQGDP